MLDRLSAVSSTALITLYCRARASRQRDPVLRDPEAERLAAALAPALAARDDPLSRMLLDGKLPAMLVNSMSLRADYFDSCVRGFLTRWPGGVIVNLGCGLDSRFQRIDDGSIRFYDVDLPPVMAVKSDLLPPTDRYRQIASSVLDFGWMDQPAAEADGPVLFLAEGLFMYLPEDDVRRLVLVLRQTFPGSELVCEVFNRRWLEGRRGRMMRRRLKERLHFDDDAVFQSGLATPNEMESWAPGIRFLGGDGTP